MDTPSSSAKSNSETMTNGPFELVRMALIDIPPNVHRFESDDPGILDLAASIRSEGLLEPLIVRPMDDRYELVAGNRRYAALKSIQCEFVGCHIKQLEDDQAASATFAENFHRKNITPLEQAVAIAREYQEGRMTVNQLAIVFKKSEDWVLRQVAICGWPDDVLGLIHREKISISAAANLALVEDETYRKFLCDQAEENGATARTTAAWLQGFRSMLPPTEAVKHVPEPGSPTVQPLTPQAPCVGCTKVMRMDALSYTPLCPDCIQALRQAQQQFRDG